MLMVPIAHGPSSNLGSQDSKTDGQRSPLARLLILRLFFMYQRHGKFFAFDIPILVV